MIGYNVLLVPHTFYVNFYKCLQISKLFTNKWKKNIAILLGFYSLKCSQRNKMSKNVLWQCFVSFFVCSRSSLQKQLGSEAIHPFREEFKEAKLGIRQRWQLVPHHAKFQTWKNPLYIFLDSKLLATAVCFTELV